MDALGVDPKMLELPHLLSEGALVAAIHEAIPNLPPRVDDFPRTPDLVPDNGSSLRYVRRLIVSAAQKRHTDFLFAALPLPRTLQYPPHQPMAISPSPNSVQSITMPIPPLLPSPSYPRPLPFLPRLSWPKHHVRVGSPSNRRTEDTVAPRVARFSNVATTRSVISTQQESA